MTHEHEWLGQRFEQQRSQLRCIAYRMLGSSKEADDAVREAWLRLREQHVQDIDNLEGWLTTVVGGVCLEKLRARKARREEILEVATTVPSAADPDRQALLADAAGATLMVVLDSLVPAERLAFVLHDLFEVPFEAIGPIMGRSPTAARKLASRARRRVHGAPTVDGATLLRQRVVIETFLAALRAGDLAALISVLDPNLEVRAEAPGGVVREVKGADNWARQALASKAVTSAQPALVNGAAGLIIATGTRLLRALGFIFVAGRIARIDVTIDPQRLRDVDVGVLPELPKPQASI